MASTEVAKVAEDKNAAAAAPVSLGKGAWDCDNNCEIPPDKEAEVFEEIATMDFPYEGIPTIPPRKNMTHLAFFCNGCRYRVEAYPDWTGEQVAKALWRGGIERANNPNGNTPGMKGPEDIALIYAGQVIPHTKKLEDFNVPPVSMKRAYEATSFAAARFCSLQSLTRPLLLYFRSSSPHAR